MKLNQKCPQKHICHLHSAGGLRCCECYQHCQHGTLEILEVQSSAPELFGRKNLKELWWGADVWNRRGPAWITTTPRGRANKPMVRGTLQALITAAFTRTSASKSRLRILLKYCRSQLAAARRWRGWTYKYSWEEILLGFWGVHCMSDIKATGEHYHQTEQKSPEETCAPS